MKFQSLLFTMLVAVLSFAQSVPTITSFTPASGAAIGGNITINGSNFSTTAANNTVWFGGVKGTVTAATASQLTVTVPKTTAISNLSVVVGGLTSNYKYFKLKNTSTGSLNLTWSSQYFKTPTTLTLTNNASVYAWEPADLDNDGDLDFITASNTNAINIITNSGANTNFTLVGATQTNVSLSTTSCTITDIKTGDINNDGFVDILVSLNTGKKVEILKNNGDGTYTSQGVVTFSNLYANVNSLSLYDINNDGKLDIIGSSYGTYSSAPFQIFSQSSSTPFSFSNYYTPPTGVSYWFTMRNGVANVNNDSYPDVFILAGSGTNTEGLNVALGTSSAFNSMTNITGSTDMMGYTDIYFLDIDNDGDIDVIAPGESNQRIYTNNGAGSFTMTSVTGYSRFGQLFDIDNDNDLDFIGSNYFGLKGLQNNAGTYDSGVDFLGSIQYTGESQLLDLTGDGYLDAAFIKQDGSTFYTSIFQGNPTPTITTSVNTLSAFSACAGSVSTNQSFTVSGSTLSAGIVITPPTGFEISSTSATAGYQTTALTLNQSGGTVSNTTIYVRTTTSATGSPSGNITLTSTGATQKNVSVSGTVNANNTAGTASSTPTLCVNTSLTNITHTTTGATGISAGSNLPAGVTAAWSANTITISGTPTASGTFSYTIPLTGGCGSVNATGTITVTPALSAGTASSTPGVCDGSAMTAVTHATTGATGFGYPTGLPAGMSLAYSNNTLTISGAPSNTYNVGDYYNGGRIAYIFQPNDNGYVPGKVIIVNPQYILLGTLFPSCNGRWTMQTQTASTSSAIGEGLNNTTNLVAAGHTNTSYAVGWTNAYTDGTYSDWFVPSYDELYQIMTNISTFTQDGFPARSSTENPSNLTQTLSYQKSGGVAVAGVSNDGGCSNLIIARYDILPTPTSVQTFNYTIPLTGSCGSASATGTITITDSYTWTGQTNTSATTASNWNPAAVPCSGANIVIPSGAPNYPSYTNLTINAGTTITVQSGGRLTVTGTLTNNGTLTIESGATFLQGTSLAGSGTYSVKQTVTGAGGATPTGRFWYMGLPINNLTRATAFGTASGSNRLWSWSESGQVWSSQITDATTLTPTTGYVFRTGATSTTLNFSGTSLYSANPTISGLTNSGGSFDGCHLMSNPYTAYLDWEQVIAAAGTTNLSSTYCVRSFNSTNSEMVYDTYNATGDVSVNPSGVAMTQYIAPMQSFWITVNPSTTGTLSMTKAMLSHQAGAVGLKDITSFAAFARLNLVSGNFYDQVVVYTDANANAELEDYDSKKFFLPNKAQVYCPVGNEKLVINALKQGKAQTSAPLTVELPSTQVYKFEMAESFVENGLVILEDKQEGIFQDMGVNPIYEFFGNSGVIADRFVLHFQLPNGTNNEGQAGIEDLTSGQIAVIANHDGAITVALSADLTTSGDVQIFDEAGRLVAQKAITSAQTSLQLSNGMGVYFVRVQTPMKTEMKKVMVY